MKSRLLLAVAVPLVSVFAVAPPVTASDRLSITTASAPITPDGVTAGAQTDFVVTFADRDPATPGIDIKAGGTVSVRLPKAFKQVDASAPMTMVPLQGWPQSPRLPFPDVVYDAQTSTLTGTLSVDYLYESSEGPGLKQVHLLLPGFVNPHPGRYGIGLTIQPDPGIDHVMRGWGPVWIRPDVPTTINAINVINGAPPPPFPNSIYQTVEQGETPLLWGFYLWDRDAEPYVGVDLVRINKRRYAIVDADGRRIGGVKIDAPRHASGYTIDANASVLANGAVLGIPTGLLTAQFHPDPGVAGDYVITWRLWKGNAQDMFVTVAET